MFITTAGFKSLIKDAYKGPGLRIGNDGENYDISGGYWMINIKNDRLPKKELAAIIELTGELPGEGERFEATTAGNQYEITENELYKRIVKESGDIPLHVTNLSIHGKATARILQMISRGEIVLINEKFIDIIKNKAIEDEKGETPPEGPYIGRTAGIFWFNNIMSLIVMPRPKEGVEAILSHLEEISIEEDPE